MIEGGVMAGGLAGDPFSPRRQTVKPSPLVLINESSKSELSGFKLKTTDSV